VRVVEIVTTVVGTPWRELTFVELVTDDGRRGVGEVRMLNKTDTLLACISELGQRYVIGTDPFERETLAASIQRVDYSRPGEVTQSVLALFDMACWDLMGQALGVPVWRLLGGQCRNRVPAYANGWYQGNRDGAALADAARSVVSAGYRGLKLDPFGSASGSLPRSERRRSVDLVAAVRDAVGPDIEIMVEMHGRFSADVAAELAADLEPLQPAWVEEPVALDIPTGLARVRGATRVPIATGERIHLLSDYRTIIEQGLVDIVQADLTHFGGITGLRRLAGWAEAYGLALAPHNVGGPVATAANVHFAIATPNYRILEHFNAFADPWVNDLVDPTPEIELIDGCFRLPTAPGLGVRLDREACAEHPRTHARLALFADGWEDRRSQPLVAADAHTATEA